MFKKMSTMIYNLICSCKNVNSQRSTENQSKDYSYVVLGEEFRVNVIACPTKVEDLKKGILKTHYSESRLHFQLENGHLVRTSPVESISQFGKTNMFTFKTRSGSLYTLEVV